MNVIVTGATGMAGKAIVKQCLDDERVAKVQILTRKSLEADIEGNPKTEVILHEDFSTYPDDLMEKLKGADACIWAIGGRVMHFNHDVELCRKVSVGYTLAFAKAVCKQIASETTSGKPFRFVFCSGKYSEWDPNKSLLFLGDSRRIKGEVEKGLCDLADANAECLEVLVLRPTGFMDDNAPMTHMLVGSLYGAIKMSQLGRAFVQVTCEGADKRILENEEMMRM